MPRELTDTEFTDWRDKLAHSDLVWKEIGLHDESMADVHAKRFLNFYRGCHRDYLTTGFKKLVVDNVFFSAINTLISLLFARNPQTDVITEDAAAKDNANRQERLINYLLKSPRLKLKREYNRVLLDALIMRFGVLQHGYTPTEEKFDRTGNLIDRFSTAQPDFPWSRRVAPWDVRIDPLGETFDADRDARWVAFRHLYFLSEVRKHPRLIARRDLKANRSLRETRFREGKKEEQSPEWVKLVEVWWIYDKMQREVFAISDASDKALSQAYPWPPWMETLPYDVLQFNQTPDEPWGTSYSEQAIPLQEEMNWLLTIANDLAKSLRRIPIINPDGLQDGQIAKLNDLALIEFLFTNNVAPNLVFGEMKIGGGFQELLPLILFIKDEMRTLLGISEMDRGNRINVETADESSRVGAGAAAQRGRNQGPWEDFLSDAITKFARAVQFTVQDEIAVPILGDEDARELFRSEPQSGFSIIGREQIQGDFIYRVRPGSTLPHDPNAELRKELALNQAFSLPHLVEAINWPQRLIETLRTADKDPRKELADADLVRKVADARAAAGEQKSEIGQTGGSVAAGLDRMIGRGNGGAG